MKNQHTPNKYNSDIMHYYGTDGFDFKKVLSDLHLDKSKVAFATNIDVSEIDLKNSHIPNAVRLRIQEWATAINKVALFFNDADKTMDWFKSPNPQLANLSPRDLIITGRFQKLLQFINSSLD